MDRLQTSTDLADALDTGSGLILHFQPGIDLRSNLPAAAEALVRWRHSTRGLVPPNDFIGVAEETGLIAPLGRWVLDTAVGQLAAWHGLMTPESRVHVNHSPREFQYPGLVDTIADTLDRHHVRPTSLLLEITETGLTGGVESMEVLRKLDDIRGSLGIDDFGIGYSSISYLRDLPFDTVKLNRSLISGVASSPHEYGLTRAILELIDSTGLRVVAEGIESAVQVAHLRALNCRCGQVSILRGRRLLSTSPPGCTAAPHRRQDLTAEGSIPLQAVDAAGGSANLSQAGPVTRREAGRRGA